MVLFHSIVSTNSANCRQLPDYLDNYLDRRGKVVIFHYTYIFCINRSIGNSSSRCHIFKSGDDLSENYIRIQRRRTEKFLYAEIK